MIKHIALAAVTVCCLTAPALAGLYDAYEPDGDGVVLSPIAAGFWRHQKFQRGDLEGWSLL
jgi:hypothetical protein